MVSRSEVERVPLVVAVGSMNDAKLAGVDRAFKARYPASEIEVQPYPVESLVSEMPRTVEDMIKGAHNRMVGVGRMVTNAAFIVGLEGGVFENDHGTFLEGWTVIGRPDAAYFGIGRSACPRVPSYIADRLKAGEELGHIIEDITKDDKIRKTTGANGYSTDGLYPRDMEYEDSTRCALGDLLVKERDIARGADCH